jgi:hypothetical protein
VATFSCVVSYLWIGARGALSCDRVCTTQGKVVGAQVKVEVTTQVAFVHVFNLTRRTRSVTVRGRGGEAGEWGREEEEERRRKEERVLCFMLFLLSSHSPSFRLSIERERG